MLLEEIDTLAKTALGDRLTRLVPRGRRLAGGAMMAFVLVAGSTFVIWWTPRSPDVANFTAGFKDGYRAGSGVQVETTGVVKAVGRAGRVQSSVQRGMVHVGADDSLLVRGR